MVAGAFIATPPQPLLIMSCRDLEVELINGKMWSRVAISAITSRQIKLSKN
jgi:hypothetical protein